MYQGKFDQKNKKTSLNVQEARQQSAQQERTSRPEPQRSAARSQAAQTASSRASRQQAQQPVRQAPVQPQVQAEPQRRGPRLGSVIFYTLYFLFIFLFFVATFFGLQWLHAWLSDYEAAQPTVRCQEVFDQVFADPDWATLYDVAGFTDTEFESKDAYVAYMENYVGDQELTYQETAAGLSGDRRYFVKLGDERLGSFTLVAEGERESVTDIVNWQLGTIELQLERHGSYKIQMPEEHTASVNGVKLGEDYTIQISTIRAQDYLPEGVYAPQTVTQQITGLLMKPEVKVMNSAGTEVEVTYDEASQTFIAVAEGETAVIGDEEKEVALAAAKAFSYRMIEEYNKANLTTYFNTKSQIYKTITSITPWMQDHNGYRFVNEEVTQYCRYSENIFSAKVSFSLNVTRTDGSVKEYTVDSTLFFEKNAKGKWLCFEMVNTDVQEPIGEVRLTFLDDTGATISTDFYPNDSSELTTPLLSAPSGKVFSGWVREETAANGAITQYLVFQPDEFGKVVIDEGNRLEPMVLKPLFEDPSEAAQSAPAAPEAAPETTAPETTAAAETETTEG